MRIRHGWCRNLQGGELEDEKEDKAQKKHHAFPGKPWRRISEENGFTVRLCARHHRNGPEAAHKNSKSLRLIQKDVQREYEKTHTREEWMKLMERNYLWDE